jgi:hypothetical protein
VRLNPKVKRAQTSSNMTAISDAVVIGIVLGLVFAAVSYYLYSRVGQLERKVGLLENIMLDLKVTTEQSILSATEPPEPAAPTVVGNSQPAPVDSSSDETQQYREAMARATNESVSDQIGSVSEQDAREVFVDSSSRGRSQTTGSVQVDRESSGLSVNYEAMTYKELQQLCKQRSIQGTRNVSKATLIDLLRGKTPSSVQSDLSSWTSGTASFTDLSGQSGEGIMLGSALEPIPEGGPIHDSAPESSFVQSDA